jgi:uncharacterized OB-fold protein
MKLSKENGRDFEQNPSNVVFARDLRIRQNNAAHACLSCGMPIITNQNYCYHCGARM